jgi:prenyltransferase beta subunit
VLGIIIIIIAWTSPLAIFDGDNSTAPLTVSPDAQPLDIDAEHILSADDGIVIDWSPVIVLEMPGYSIPARGSTWLQVLRSEGIVASVVTVSELMADPTIIHAAPVILVDGSLGADNGSHISLALIDILVGEDASIVLTGRSAWRLHLLRERGPPSEIALSATQLITAPGYVGAIYLSSPIPLTIGSALTTEIPVNLPKDPTQIENSRLVDLTGSESSSLASLRYDSWPLDTYLLGMEDPSLMTAQGRGLVVNTLAYSMVLRENPVSLSLADSQSEEDEMLAGGYSYSHEPTIAGVYYAVQIAYSLMSGAEWSSWKSANQALVLSCLESLLVDFGTESGFLTSAIDGSVGCKSTGQGLWVLSVMDLSSQFAVSEIISYLSTRQDVDGGFENHITTSYQVTESLESAGYLGSIDSSSLETWLRSCVIDGSKTSDPDLWGSIAPNPISTSPTNQYASQYVQALTLLGTAHDDPVKLTSWIVTRTSIGDGSFRDTVGPAQEIALGTASALTAMAVMGTLSVENHTSGLNWLTGNQLESGGYGLKTKDSDIVGKSKESHLVSVALKEMGETSDPIASGLRDYLSLIETTTGYELMEPIPSLMWNYWLTSASRLNHARGSVNDILEEQYLSYFTQWTQYPFWANLTSYSAPEYAPSQYRTKSVWTQYFGAATAHNLGVSPPSEVVSDALNYITMSQYVTGHFRPAMFIGTAHMQHSVAAIEALYLLDSLDNILYRSALESALLAEYSAGHWSSTDWTIHPFADEQAAIDWLCTRAAIRLDIVDTTMAAEISSTISSRIQYNDLYALSRDVAILALLNSSGFSVDLMGIDELQILSALGPIPFDGGWLNSTHPWQPVFTSGVMEMVSILGLKPAQSIAQGSTISISTDPDATLGSTLDIDVVVSSMTPTHTLLAYAFGEWYSFNNVADSDVLVISVPSDMTALGPADIFVVVCDWGCSRAYGISTLEVRGILEGSLAIDTPIVSAGSLINGSLTWFISPGAYAGLTNITVRLGDPPTYHQWSYQDVSQFGLHVPSNDFTTGTYNLTVTLERQYCDALILRDTVDIVAPVHTYMLSSSLTTGTVGQQAYIDWSLHYSSNGIEIASQLTTITIVNELDQVVHTEQGVSLVGGSVFYWTPSQRGNFSYTITFAGNGSLVGCESSGLLHVYEDTVLAWLTTGTMDQYTMASLEARLETSNGIPLVGYAVHVTVTSPSSFTLVDIDLTTNSTGYVSVPISLNENGVYDLDAVFTDSGYLQTSVDSEVITSWSESTLTVGGISGDNHVGFTWDIWAQLKDSASSPVSGEAVTLRVILLPSTIVDEYTLTTNSTGHVQTILVGDSAGSYRLEAEYTGTGSRGIAYASSNFALWVPVTLSMAITQTPEVGVQTWIEVIAGDHLGNPINGLSVTVTVLDPQGGIQIQESGIITGGRLQIAWIPLFRGLNSISASSGQQSWYGVSLVSQNENVYEQLGIDMLVPLGQKAPSLVNVIVSLMDYHGIGVSGIPVRTIISINGQLLIDVTNTTQGDGTISHLVQVLEPGTLSTSIIISAQEWILAASASSSDIIVGATEIELTSPILPIKQGTPAGIVVTLNDWSGAALDGAQVTIEILWSNGTVVVVANRVTGADGKCTLAHDFDSVGDFIINANYAGDALNSSAMASALQRVYMTPTMLLNHSPSCMLGETLEIHVGITDANQRHIAGRILIFSIEQNSIIVFETQVESIDGMETIHWDPVDRGIATMTLLHAGNPYYITNSTESTISVLELVSAELILDLSSIDLFTTAALRYTLLTTGTQSGVLIHFEVLGLDLVPVWTADLVTNGSGVAEVFYFAGDVHGILTIRASPTTDQFLIGGDTQEQLNVMTTCTIATSLVPDPPITGQDVNITVLVIDQLGSPVENLDIVVSLDNPLGDPVKLGVWSNSITVTTSDGVAVLAFVPAMSGLYSVHLSCSGATSVHGFTDDTYHTVYSQSSVDIGISETELEVGDMLDITALLADYQGSPMANRNITITIDGPGGSMLGPTVAVTNSTGYSYWSVQLDDEGLWTVTAVFDGLGVYLAASDAVDVSVRYGTAIQASVISTGDVVAGITPASLSVLLMDSGGTPLEGFTIDYSSYHDLLGLTLTDSVVQIGQDPIILNITLDRMGNYTILLEFAGTAHYYASNAALRIWVYGTTNISVSVSSSIERSSDSYLTASFIDEVGSNIALSELNTSPELHGPAGTVDLTNRLLLTATEISISLEGLDVGQYTLNLTIQDSSLRVGSTTGVQFDIVAFTSIMVQDESFSGIIDDHHEFAFTLVDSLGDIAGGATVYVSLYTPDGREIHGSPLTTRTAYSISSEVISISWVPSLAGNYSLILTFEGETFWFSASVEFEVLVRYPVVIQIEHPVSMEFGQSIPLSITVSSGVFKVKDAPLTIRVWSNNDLLLQQTALTGTRGGAKIALDGILAGNLTVEVVFDGTASFAPATSSIPLIVSPVLLIDLTPLNPVQVGSNCTLNVSYTVLGVTTSWNGGLEVLLLDPMGQVVDAWILIAHHFGYETIEFPVQLQGEYRANITISNLPVVDEMSSILTFEAISNTPSIPMDAGTAPWVGGLGIIAAVAVLVWKRVGVIVGKLPGEWES